MKQAGADSPIKVFGVMLAFYRDRAGLSYDQLGALVGLSGSMIRKVKAGSRAATGQLVNAIEALPELGCDGALRALFDAMRDYLKNGVFPGWFQGWPEKEEHSVRLRTFSLEVLDGLLQTDDYARAILSTRVGITADQLDAEVAARIARQAVFDRDKPLEYWAIIDESALRRPVGSREIMREALTHIAQMARRPNIVVLVVPLETGAHQGLNGGPFIIAQFDDASDVAYLDTPVAGQIIEDQDAVRELTRIWDMLQRVTLPETESMRIIEEAVGTWT